ncbi:MAG: hypothetical protein HY648_05650 [Acidobacteria bacterium]|nr:hypothetical protein [Acidobacteriota bacterium]
MRTTPSGCQAIGARGRLRSDPVAVYNPPMQKSFAAALQVIFFISAFLTPWALTRAWAQEPEEVAEGSQPAYAASLAFELRPQRERATFHLRQPDAQTLYQAIAEAYGIHLIYDRDLQRPRIASNFDLEEATLQEALDAAGSISHTFVAPLDEQTGIVTADTAQKRGEYERQVMASFHADAQTTPQQLTEISTALRTMLDLRRVVQDTRGNWITVAGRIRQATAAARFFQTLQKPAGEVVLEIEVWEVNSRRLRELGILPPQPFMFRYLGQPQLVLELLRQLQTSGGLSGFTFGKGRTLYGVTVPGVGAQANFSSSLVRSQQTLSLRASHGQAASLRVGQRFPLITATVSSRISVLGGAEENGGIGFIPAIQYEDLGVIAKVTPYLHADHEVTLQLEMGIRDLGSRDANNMPTITNREVKGQIRLLEGESYVVAGLRNNSEQRSTTGYPWLSRIPVLGALFGVKKRQQDETEFWLVIRPHIVRGSPAEEFASAAIFFGKELTGLPPAPPEPLPAPPAQAPGQPAGQPTVPGVIPGVPIPGAPQPPVVPPVPGAPEPGAVPAVPLPGIPGVPVPGTIPVPGAVQIVPGETPGQPPTVPQPLPEPGQESQPPAAFP